MKREIFNDDHAVFRESVQAWIRRDVLPNAETYIDEKVLPREFWLSAGEQGFLGLEIPEIYGGQEAGDFRFNAILHEELSRVSVAIGSAWGIHADVTAPYIVELGTEAQKHRWLPYVASGEVKLAIAMTEPGGGSDLAALKTTAVRHDDEWVLNGSKTFITNGDTADMVLVAARTAPELGAKGITLFGVEANLPGFTRGRKLDKVGQPEADTAELFFENVLLSDADIIGELNQGFIHMMRALAQERVGSAVANVAHAKAILEETLQYTKDRQAFGQPIGSFQHNKFLLAELFTAIEVAEAYVDKCVAAHANADLTAVEAAKAKWWSAQVQNDVLDHCVQIYGGYGFMNEYRVARAWRDARVTKIWAGSNEIMKEIIGRNLGL